MYGMQQMGTAFQQLEGAGWQALGGLLSAGRKPRIPQFPSLQDAQTQAIGGNIAAFDQATDLASRTNTFNQDELNRMLRASIPGYDDIVARGSSNIQSQLRGEIPQDVALQINRRSAAQALAGGYGGSGMARNLEARDLGLTSYGLTQQGLSSAMQWMASARKTRMAPQMDITSMFVTPQQQGEWNFNRFQRDLLAAGVAAMPDPRRAALGGALINFGGARMGSAGSGGGGDMSGMFSMIGGGGGGS